MQHLKISLHEKSIIEMSVYKRNARQTIGPLHHILCGKG